MNVLKVFSGNANPNLAKKICDYLDVPMGQIKVERFPDGETFCRVEEDVRGVDVFIVQSTCRPVNDSLMELLIMIESFKRASADRITAVIPYFGYARQDRKDEGRVPITAKLVANLITRAGADRVLTMDLHAAQIQGFFDIPVDHLSAAPILDGFVNSLGFSAEESVVVSPDEGSIKRAARHVSALGGTLAIIDKRRHGNIVEQANLIGGPIEGKIAFLFDDIISTGGSICGAAHLLKKMGAKQIYIAATHGVLCGNAVDQLRSAPIELIALSDTIPLLPECDLPNVKVLTTAPVFGEAIRRIHRNESISQMFKNMPFGAGQYF